MNEEQFRQQLMDNGFGEGEYKEFAPNTDGPMHSHDFAVMLLVVSGEFTLAKEREATTYRPGEICELAAGAQHTERTGSDGATVLLGKKSLRGGAAERPTPR